MSIAKRLLSSGSKQDMKMVHSSTKMPNPPIDPAVLEAVLKYLQSKPTKSTKSRKEGQFQKIGGRTIRVTCNAKPKKNKARIYSHSIWLDRKAIVENDRTRIDGRTVEKQLNEMRRSQFYRLNREVYQHARQATSIMLSKEPKKEIPKCAIQSKLCCDSSTVGRLRSFDLDGWAESEKRRRGQARLDRGRKGSSTKSSSGSKTQVLSEKEKNTLVAQVLEILQKSSEIEKE